METAHVILVLVGSLRKESINLKFAKALARLAPAEYEFRIQTLGDLPLFNQDEEQNPAPSVTALKTAVRQAAGVVFVTPEYNRSIPGVLKNALDHGSRPYGDSAWKGKPAAVMGVTGGAAGTAMAQQHLRNILAYLDMPTLGQPELFLRADAEFFDADGGLGKTSSKLIQGWMGKYIEWVERFAPNNSSQGGNS
ncbi:MAG TPA: NAD(P)H-dependent oxidoreductase [Fibrobacteria bacterium]|jgi:chromate reductase|nr:NAD(P)H-dependent oxidoreductase [Fibrobacteria bacterium]